MKKYKYQLILLFYYFFFLISYIWFISWNVEEYNSFDWGPSIGIIYNAIKISIQKLEIPYYYSGFGENIQTLNDGEYNLRWFASGHTSVSPFTILFSFFNLKITIALETALYFSLGFFGIYLWNKELKLKPVFFFWICFTWFFNGALYTRWSVGHIPWASVYFYIPLYTILFYKFIKLEKNNVKDHLILSLMICLLIFFSKLSHNAQPMQQIFIIIFFVGLVFIEKIKYALLIIFLSFFTLAFYLIPTALYSDAVLSSSNRVIFGGYGFFQIDGCYDLHSTTDKNFLLKLPIHFINIFKHIILSITQEVLPRCDAVWEYTLYVSIFGLIILLTGCIYGLKKIKINKKIVILIFIIFTLSISNFLRIIGFTIDEFFYIPKIDRLPSRLMMYVFFSCTIFCAYSINHYFVKKKNNFLKVSFYLLFLLQFLFVIFNFFKWQVSNASKYYVTPINEVRINFLPKLFNDKFYEKGYILTVNFSYLISIISVILIIYFLMKLKNCEK